MKKLSKVEKFNIIKTGIGAYVGSSLVAWLKSGGLQFINNSQAWVIKIHKSWGVVEVFRPGSFLFDKLDVFSSDFLYVVVGMFSSVIAMGIIKTGYYLKNMKDEPQVEKSEKGYKVKINRQQPSPPQKEYNVKFAPRTRLFADFEPCVECRGSGHSRNDKDAICFYCEGSGFALEN